MIGGRSSAAGSRISGLALGPQAESNLIVGNDIRPGRGWGDFDIDEAAIGIRVRGNSNAIAAKALTGAQDGCLVLEPGAWGNVVLGNVLSGCTSAMTVASTDNLVAWNSFLENRTNARDRGGGNRWDLDGQGNYWSDYAGSASDSDGIGDSPYAVPPEGVDGYPLVESSERSSGS